MSVDTTVQDSIIDEFKSLLSTTVPTNRAPTHFDLALKHLSSPHLADVADSQPTGFEDKAINCAKIFMSCGFFSFFVYLLFRHQINHKLIDQLKSVDLEAVAVTISNLKPHNSTVLLINHTLWEAKLAKQRRDFLDTAGISYPKEITIEDTESVPKSYRPRKRLRLSGRQNTIDIPPTSQSPFISHSMVSSTSDNNLQPQVAASYQHSAGQQLVHSITENTSESSDLCLPTVRLGELFPHKLAPYIIRTEQKVAFSPSFPSEPSKCCFFVDIEGHQAVSLANLLYGVKIDEIDTKRWVVSDSGAKVKIRAPLRLTGMPVDHVQSFFGPMVKHAFDSSGPRMKEVRLGYTHFTHHVRLEIPPNPQTCLRFKVKTDATCLRVLLNQFYPLQ